jgi:uncharacterized protein (TIGR01777 family)
MRVMITGGSGLIGRRLAESLASGGHEVVIVSRSADHVRRDPAMWSYKVVQGDPTASGPWQDEVEHCDVIVNLAGHNLFANRWNTEIKRKIRDSRVHSAEKITATIKSASARPKAFVQGSAIGFYGPHQDEEITESGHSGTDFLAVVCRELEDASHDLDALGVRRVLVRTGIVLAPNDGALKIMTPIFKLGPGAPIGSGGGPVASGQQWMSWIHIDDIVGLFQLAIENEHATGPLNGTAPNPVRNAEFSKTFSAVLKTPLTPWRVFLPVGPPDQLLGLVLGEVASVVTTGQRVLPEKARALGYHFKYPQLFEALAAIFPREKPRPQPAAAPAKAHAGSGHH